MANDRRAHPPPSTPLLSGMPRFLGYVPQRFGVYRGDVAAAYARYLPQIERHVESDLVSVLRDLNANLPVEGQGGRVLGEIKDFRTLAAAPQIEGCPMKDVVGAGNPGQRQEAEEAFRTLATKIMDKIIAQS